MIKLDLSQAVFFYLLFTVVGVLILWIFFEERLKFIYFREEDICVWQCEICAYTYVDSLHREISRCPVCKSYNTRDKSQVSEMADRGKGGRASRA